MSWPGEPIAALAPGQNLSSILADMQNTDSTYVLRVRGEEHIFIKISEGSPHFPPSPYTTFFSAASRWDKSVAEKVAQDLVGRFDVEVVRIGPIE